MTALAQSSSSVRTVVVTLGLLQILAWGSTFYLLSVLGKPIATDMGWPYAAVIGGLSLALLMASVVSPFVGRTIAARGGRPVLAASAALIAMGLAALALSRTLPASWGAWAAIGCGMGAGLYDPAFSTLGQLYGSEARRLITSITLFGGFASTVSWPATAYLLDKAGWRATCWTYAALELVIAVPAYLMLLPQRPVATVAKAGSSPAQTEGLPRRSQTPALILLGTVLTLGAGMLSFMSTHLLTLLQARGFDLAAAVALGALVGPSQVGARILEMAFGRDYHPLWTMLAGTLAVAAGIALLWSGWPVVALALIVYGMGNGINSIVRGTVPLVLFGPARYPVLMGRLGLPILLAMALAPAAGAPLIEYGGAGATFATLIFVALIDVGLALALLRFRRQSDF